MTASLRKATKRKSSSGRREKAIRFYKQNTIDHVSKHFLPFFEKLDRFSDEDIAGMTEAIETLTDNCKATEPQPPKMKYIKLD